MKNIQDALRVLLIDHSQSDRRALENVLAQKADMQVIASLADSIAALEVLRNEPVDVIVTDLVLSGTDGFAFLESIRQQNWVKEPWILVLTALCKPECIQRSLKMGVDYYMLKPFDPTCVYQRIVDLYPQTPTKKAIVRSVRPDRSRRMPFVNSAVSQTSWIDVRITEILFFVGVPAQIKGFQYLREGIKMVMENPKLINRITRELYPMIAQKFGATSTKVERAIRHAIKVAWSKNKLEKLNQLFGVQIYCRNEKPTNGELIALIADSLMVWQL
ncbi:MAG: sporulation transcription factor Spo0A [Peptococcaceae bacterium]|nr:sporulation transcription factor Spo0A [Peptococcaceae bacterium]